MKYANYLLGLIILTALAAAASVAQTTEKPKNPAYNAALAKKVGADQRGMKMYVLVILKTGPNDATIKGKERDDIFNGHFANISRMAKEGTLVVAGPFDDGNGDWRGLYLFN